MSEYRYVKPTQVPRCPYVGNLYQARQWKANAWKGVKALRLKLKDELRKSLSVCNPGAVRLELMRAERAHFDASMSETAALRTIEEFANTQGLTTKR